MNYIYILDECIAEAEIEDKCEVLENIENNSITLPL